MNKIEEGMMKAVAGRYEWRSGNTQVVPDETGGVAIYLHGNHIATVLQNGNVLLNVQTVQRWPTATTVSRLRALDIPARRNNLDTVTVVL